jgi:uncharacterized protein YdeI (YjbR/CyaY-like superfamily)
MARENHHSKQLVWLVYYKKKPVMPTISLSEAVDEVIFFGWIDVRRSRLTEQYTENFSARESN